MIKLENKLYSSTEVAEILGVSLRSVYRYLEEGKLHAEVKTATGRHRFTRQNIVDFLYPSGIPEEESLSEQSAASVSSPQPRGASFVSAQASTITAEDKKEPVMQPDERAEESPLASKPEPTMRVESQKVEEKAEEKEDEQVDWLAKFREAAKKFEEDTEQFSDLSTAGKVAEEEKAPKEEMFYYRSRLGGLKDIAQNIDRTSRNSGLDYAFTLNAGLSLYRPISPFSLLHVYIRPKDKDFFERILALVPSDESSAQLCIITSDEDDLYAGADEMHGLRVVNKKRLLQDITKMKDDLVKEAENILV
ncbi:MAG TPA: helix-turn-helix domain-containing protein [bacterium]|jgi:predicted transcriptional regulator|nr:helix-turn-helix domain-containing protein [bacterium]